MVHRAGEVLVEDERHAAGFAKAAIGKADAVSFDMLGWRGLVRMAGHGRSPNVRRRKGFWMSESSARRLAAVDPDDLAGDERRLVGSEERDGVRDLFRPRTAFERYGGI